MKLKPGVDATDVEPGIWLWLGAVSRAHWAWAGHELVVTSLRRKPVERASWHAPKNNEGVRAVDFRRWHLDGDELTEPFCRMLQARYGEALKVMLEPEWLSARELELRGGILNVDPHIHLELRSLEWPVGIL